MFTLFASVLLPALAVAVPTLQSSLGLHALATLRGKYVGTATEAMDILNNTAFGHKYGQIALSDNFGIYTNENFLKWETTEPEPGKFNFTPAEELFALAESHGKRMRGHTLVWHSQLADWVTSSNFTKPELEAVVKRHIQAEVGHFKGRVFAWDVVNEAFNDTDGSLSSNVFLDTIGPDYIEMAFRWAHEADPNALLFINDFNIEGINVKSTGLLNVVQQLKSQGVPIHGVGVQSHLIIGEVPTDFQQSLQRFTDAGVFVALTELDIRGNIPETEAQLQQQAIDYKTAFDACLGVEKCLGVTAWEFTDALSWIPGTFPTQGFGDLYDEDINIKPAYTAARNALISDHPKPVQG